MSISIARKTAFQKLLRIERDGSYSSELLAAKSDGISVRDVNLIHSLTLGVLRKQILLDFVIDLYSKTKTVDQDLEVLCILRLGLFQLLFMDKIPGYSAVNEAVELTRFAKKASASGLVNAVLRKASKWNGILPEMKSIEKLSIETSHPVWLLSKWSDEFGTEKAVEIANSNNSEPRPAFRFTSAFDALNKAAQAEIVEEFESRNDICRSVVAEGGFTAERSDPSIRSLAEKGIIYLQDQGSQLVGACVIEKAGRSVLDLCAAPGSKATQIARTLRPGEMLAAAELNFGRARLLRRIALRQRARLGVLCADGTVQMPFSADTFDTVLVDAPCTGTGTIRRNPEIRYKIDRDDIRQLKRKQLLLLDNASKVLKAGGAIIYSTCSLEREENEEVVFEFLREFPGFHSEPSVAASANLTENGFARIFPGEKGCDGFFIACLRSV